MEAAGTSNRAGGFFVLPHRYPTVRSTIGFRQDVRDAAAVDLRELPRFHEIHPAFPTLAVGHKGLGSAEELRDLNLGEPGVLPGLSEGNQHPPVHLRVYRAHEGFQ